MTTRAPLRRRQGIDHLEFSTLDPQDHQLSDAVPALDLDSRRAIQVDRDDFDLSR